MRACDRHRRCGLLYCIAGKRQPCRPRPPSLRLRRRSAWLRRWVAAASQMPKRRSARPAGRPAIAPTVARCPQHPVGCDLRRVARLRVQRPAKATARLQGELACDSRTLSEPGSAPGCRLEPRIRSSQQNGGGAGGQAARKYCAAGLCSLCVRAHKQEKAVGCACPRAYAWVAATRAG